MISLDSDVAIEHLRGNPAVKEKLTSHGQPVLSGFAFAELLLGAAKAARPADQLAILLRFRQRVSLQFADERTSYVQARLRLKLEKMGKPIPQNDFWIAALAVQHRMPLASNDSHFDLIDELQLIRFK